MTSEVHLLWTGGWDSTFRLLELLSHSHCTIQPHYIVDPERMSWQREMEAMDRIRSTLTEREPEWGCRINDTRITEKREIASDPDVEGAFREIRAGVYVGEQCCWLACYAKMSGVRGLELCVESTDVAGRLVYDKVQAVRDADPSSYELEPAESNHDGPVEEVFQWFRFPLVHRKKKEMEDVIERADAWWIMSDTWFCHRPVLARYPCGSCRPCVYVVDKGQAWRIGPIGRVRYNFIERPRHLLPAGIKKYLRRHIGERIKKFIRA